jgi:hypothetical protein
MNCTIARQQIALWVGDDLSHSAVTSLITHVDNCSPCHEFREELLHSTDVLATFNTQSLPERKSDSVWNAVKEQLPSQVPERSRRGRFMVQVVAPLTVVAALVFLALMPPLTDSSAHAMQVGEKPNLDALPRGFEPYYPDPTWRSLQGLVNPDYKPEDDRFRNVGY